MFFLSELSNTECLLGYPFFWRKTKQWNVWKAWREHLVEPNIDFFVDRRNMFFGTVKNTFFPWCWEHWEICFKQFANKSTQTLTFSCLFAWEAQLPLVIQRATRRMRFPKSIKLQSKPMLASQLLLAGSSFFWNGKSKFGKLEENDLANTAHFPVGLGFGGATFSSIFTDLFETKKSPQKGPLYWDNFGQQKGKLAANTEDFFIFLLENATKAHTIWNSLHVRMAIFFPWS